MVEGTCHQEFTGGNPDKSLTVNKNAVKVKTLERCFNERIDREMSKIVDTVEDRIQNPIFTAIDSIFARKIELAIRSINASPGRDTTTVTANSESGEHSGITAPFEIVSQMNNTLHMLNTNDETRNKTPDGVTELSVLDTHFDRQPHTHHNRVRS